MVGKKEKAKEAKEAKEGKTEKAEEVTEKVTAPPSASGASAWEEVSAPHSSTDDISKSTSLSTPAPTPAGVTPTSPAAPAAGAPLTTPSLTLSLFTAPQGLTVSRVLAALGINLVLPFINGIMLGLGEITAREGVRAARLWWRGERAIFGWRRNTNSSTGNTGTSVGLSGSAGF
jgi:hypothetical protein